MAVPYLYLSAIPESLVASMLPPERFGAYLAVGTRKRSRGIAVFFDVDPEIETDYFDLKAAEERCVPHPDGQPKHTVYVSIYRVLEHVPLSALGSLWLTTRDGRVLELEPGELPEDYPGKYHLYQEICPVHPRIASRMDPVQFGKFITEPGKPIWLPKVFFTEMKLREWNEDPEMDVPRDLPYSQMNHMQDCLLQLKNEPEKQTKTVNRTQQQSFRYRCVRNGFFVGDQERVRYYPMPSAETLERKNYEWWRSAFEMRGLR
jgi:hypothetical protein